MTRFIVFRFQVFALVGVPFQESAERATTGGDEEPFYRRLPQWLRMFSGEQPKTNFDKGTGDPDRQLGPYPGGKPDPEKSGTYLYLNCNKQAVTLNLADGRGRAERAVDRGELDGPGTCE